MLIHLVHGAYLQGRFKELADTVNARLDKKTVEQNNTPAPQISNKIDVKYQAYVNKWLEDVVNYNDNANGYAGIYGKPITAFRGNTIGSQESVGNLIYKVHTLNGRWLDEVVDRNKDKNGDDYAGIYGKTIDGIMIKSTKGIAKYRVHLLNGGWLPWVTGYNINDNVNGYAGNFGKKIDGIQVCVE